MANEIYGVPGAAVYAKVEAAYGVNPDDPNPLADTEANRVFVLEGNFDSYKPEMLPRHGISSHRPAFKRIKGTTPGPWSATVEVDHKTVSSSVFPNVNVWLLACLFSRGHANDADFVAPNVAANGGDNDEIVTYTFDSKPVSGSSSVYIEYIEFNEFDTEGLRWDLAGARADWILSIISGEPMTMELSGNSIPSAPVKVSSPATGHAHPAVEPISVLGFVGFALVDLDNDVVYGGGTVASPSMGVSVQSVIINGSVNLVGDKCISAAAGFKRWRPSPGEPWTAEILIEQVTWSDDWDVYTFLTNSTSIRFWAAVQDPTTATNYFATDMTCGIVDVVKSDDGSRRMVTLSVEGRYPKDSSDGGGLKPAPQLTLQWASQVAAP